MRIHECELAATIVQVMHPGGLRAFSEAGGRFGYVPDPVDKLLIGPADFILPPIRECLISHFSEDIIFVNTAAADATPDETAACTTDIMKGLTRALTRRAAREATVSVTPLAVIVCLPHLRLGSRQGDKAEKAIVSRARGLTCCIIFGEISYSLIHSRRPPRQRARLVGAANAARIHAIGLDDCCNLRIALGMLERTGDWNSFLQSI